MTKVIFRKWKDGQIIALFPEECGDSSPYTCLSYMHIGQHSSADPLYLPTITKLATPKEYADLKKELIRIGYKLQVIKRNRYRFQELRKKQLSQIS